VTPIRTKMMSPYNGRVYNIGDEEGYVVESSHGKTLIDTGDVRMLEDNVESPFAAPAPLKAPEKTTKSLV
jgi:hypothetical protein